MKRLATENTNTAAVYDEIYGQRKIKGPDWSDLRRWKKLLRFFRGGKILDSGCLDSNIPIIAKAILPKCEAWGIDIAAETIADMQRMYPDIAYLVMDLYHTKFKDDYFDYIVMGEVIEHLEDPVAAIKEAMRILKPKGYLAISTPLDEAKEPGAVDGEHHLWSFTIEDLMALLKPYGGVKTSILGSQHFPTYKYAWPVLITWTKKK